MPKRVIVPWQLAAMLWVLLFAGAQNGIAKAAPPDDIKVQPPPKECVGAVKQAEQLGKALFEEDVIAAWATDALFHEKILPADNRVRGWVTSKNDEGYSASFFGIEKDQPIVLYKVSFSKFSAESAKVSRVEPPVAPTGDLLAMIKARQLAKNEPFRACTPRYNTVVLPASLVGEAGWVVYLLAATTNEGEIVAGGHLRRIVSADGSKLLRTEPLSKSCLILNKNDQPPNTATVGTTMTHILTPCPIETHVYLSLAHHLPIFVGTSAGIWKVQDGKIDYLGAMKPKQGP